MSHRGIVITSIAALCLVSAGCGPSTSSTPSPAATSSGASPSPSTPTANASARASASSTAIGTPAPSVTPPPVSATKVADGDSRAQGLVRVQGKSCAGMGQGTGAFVAADLVTAPDAVTKGAEAIAVHSATGVVRGQVVARDAAHGLSIVKLLPTGDGQRLSGTPFALADAPSQARVDVVGFPLGQHAYADAGSVSTTGAQLSHTGNPAPGALGAAVLDQSGRLVGVDTRQDGTTASAAGGATLRALLAAAQKAPKPVAFAKCEVTGASMTSIHPDAAAIRGTLAQYVNGLSFPDRPSDVQGLDGLQAAWATLSPSLQKKYGSAKAFQASFGGGRTTVGNVDNLEYTDDFTDTLLWAVHVEGPGSKCVVHKQKVVLSSATGTWRIDSLTDQAAPYACEA